MKIPISKSSLLYLSNRKYLIHKSFQKFAGKTLVSLFPADGVGPEMCNAIKSIFEELVVPVQFETIESNNETPIQLYERCLQSLKRNKIALKGIYDTPSLVNQHTSMNVKLRKDLDIFANVVFIKSIPGIETRHRNVDFIIIRENTEGEYAGIEHEPVPGVCESFKVTTLEKSRKIIRFAFNFALLEGRKSLICVHKANIMKKTDGLFLKTFDEISQEFSLSGLKVGKMIVDNASMQLVMNPYQFDVIVTPNLYGNVLTNIGCGLIGGAGIPAGFNIGSEYATFEPGARHSGKQLGGKNIANPTSMILSSCLMLDHLRLSHYSDQIRDSLKTVYKEGKVKTQDINGMASTTEFVKEIIKNIKPII